MSAEPTVEITRTCIITGKTRTMTVPRTAYERWQNGMLIQEAFPYLSADDREFLISGISPEGWATLADDRDMDEAGL